MKSKLMAKCKIAVTASRVPTKMSEKSSMIFLWLLQAKNPNFQTKNTNICFCGLCINLQNQLQTDTDAHSHTQTVHEMASRPLVQFDLILVWVGNCCERLKIIMKYTNIQFCERLGHGWQFHPLTQTHTWFDQGQPTIQLILLVIELIHFNYIC